MVFVNGNFAVFIPLFATGALYIARHYYLAVVVLGTLLANICVLNSRGTLLDSEVTFDFAIGSSDVTGGCFLKIIRKLSDSKVVAVLCIICGLLIGGFPPRESVKIENFYRYISRIGYIHLYFAASFILIFGIMNFKAAKNILSRSVCAFLGKISFEVYLLHMPVIAIVSCRLFCFFVAINIIPYYLTVLIVWVLTLVVLFLLSLFVHNTINVWLSRLGDMLVDIICY